MIDSFLTFFCGKNSTKKKKVRQIFNTIEYCYKTKEYKCRSFTNPDKVYLIIYSSASREWKCNCPAITWQRYERYETKEDRNNLRKKNDCVHIIACRIYKAVELSNLISN